MVYIQSYVLDDVTLYSNQRYTNSDDNFIPPPPITPKLIVMVLRS